MIKKFNLLSTEFRLFLTFFILYTLFIHWIGWNEESRLVLTRAIVEENSFIINSFANMTGDRVKSGNNIYSDKAPAISTFLSSIYLLLKTSFPQEATTSLCVPYTYNTAVLYSCLNEPTHIVLFRLTSILQISVLFGSLSVVLFYKILKSLFKKQKWILITSFMFGLATLNFHMSIVLFAQSSSIFFALLAFYFLFFSRNFLSKLLAGIFTGFLFLIDYVNILFIFGSLIFLKFFHSKKLDKKFILGIFLGLLPIFFYNYHNFGNPLSFSFLHDDRSIHPKEIPFVNISNESILWTLRNMFFLTFGTYRGIFFYFPLLLISVFNFVNFYRKNKNLAIFSLLIFCFYFLFNSYYISWYGGGTFGPRYLSVTIPFLLLPLPILLQKIEKNKLLLFVVAVATGISVLHNFVGLGNWTEGIEVRFNYEKNDWEIIKWIKNPIYEHYLPAFIENGPRSRIFEQLIVGEIPDIRDFKTMPIREMKLFTIEPFGILTIQVPFLIVPILLLIALLIWWKELSKLRILNLRLNIFLLLIIFLLFLSRLKITQITFDKNWHPSLSNEAFKYLQKEASVFLFSPEEREVFLNLSIDSYRNKTLLLYLKNNLLNSYHAASSILEQVKLKKGENELRFIANDCEIPAYIENSSDYRCLSIVLKNISLLSKDQIDSISFGSNWYSEEKYKNQTFRYFSQNATIIVPFSGNFKINLTIQSYHSSKTLEIYVNEKLLGSFRIDGYKNLLTPTILLEKPINTIRLKSKEGCEIPAYTENSSDYRCLSFSLWNISFIKFEDLLRKNLTILYGFNFYEQEKEGRWMSDNGVIYLTNNSQLSKVFITLESFKRNRTLYVLVQNRSYAFEIPVNERKTISFAVFPENETEIKLITFPTCEIASEKDKRCLSIFIRELKVMRINELIKEKKDVEYIDFYPQERWNNITFRWFSLSSKVNILVNNSNVYVLTFNAWTPPKQKRVLKIFLNGKFVNSYSIDDSMQEINLPLFLKVGENELAFVSDNCSYVFNDPRCLGIAISEIQKEDINIQSMEKIANGFYSLEKAYGSYFRWFSNEGEISLFSSQNVSIRLYAKIGWTYFSDRNFNITLNDKLIFAEKIAKNGKEFSTKVNLLKGWNKIKFTSTCDIPAILEFSEDKRCLSLAFMSLSFLPSSS
jgi:hypothetical protein